MRTKVAAIVFFVFAVAFVWNSKREGEVKSRAANVESEIESQTAEIAAEAEPAPMAIAGEPTSVNSQTSNSPTEAKTRPLGAKEERYPENYVEIFPGLDTYRWLFGKDVSARSRKFQERYVNKHIRYEHQRKKLVELERGGFVHKLDHDFDERFFSSIKARKAAKYFFENGREIDSFDAHASELPVCVLNVDFERMPDRRLNPESRVDHTPHQRGFIESIQYPVTDYEGYRGVRIVFATDFNGGRYQWLRSFECHAKIAAGNPDSYKLIELVHLSANVGTYYQYKDPAWTKRVLGWKAFEEMFPGHRLNER